MTQRRSRRERRAAQEVPRKFMTKDELARRILEPSARDIERDKDLAFIEACKLGQSCEVQTVDLRELLDARKS